jgi:hypothetical protein
MVAKFVLVVTQLSVQTALPQSSHAIKLAAVGSSGVAMVDCQTCFGRLSDPKYSKSRQA